MPSDLSPQAVLDMVVTRSWDDDVDDRTRLVLEIAADALRDLMCRCGQQSMRAERSEARCETLERVIYGPQKGGAA
jgi:hypothetical protein